MQFPPLSDLDKTEPLRDDLFGHGQGFGDENPPDVEKMWKDFNRRLNKLFSRKKKNSDESQEPDYDDPFNDQAARPKALKIALCILIAISAFFWCGTGFYSVEEGEMAVVMTFGRFSHFSSSGIHWHMPLPIQTHEVVNVSQVRTVEIGYRNNLRNKQANEALMLTSDENIVDIQFSIQYKLKDAADWAFRHRDQENLVRQVAESVAREVVGSRTMDFVLYEGRNQIAHNIQEIMQDVLDQYRSGVLLTNVAVQEVQPPEQVLATFSDVVNAKQDHERLKKEGEAYAEEVIPKAQGAASRLKEEAEAYKQKVIANAEGDATRFKLIVAEYQKAPVVTRDRMYLETMQQIFSNTTKLMIDARAGNNLLYLPLDKLVSQTGATDKENRSEESVSLQESPISGSIVEKDRAREGRTRGGR